MTGICGWLTSAPNPQRADNLIDQMAANLPPGGSREGARPAVPKKISQLTGDFQAYDRSAGVAAVIDGTPYWADQRLARIASEKGHAWALINAYLTNKSDFHKAIQGSFALAIIDENLGTLSLAVDRLGKRPLCYARTACGEVVFASSTTSILTHPDIAAELSPQAIYNYMYFHVVPSPATAYVGIMKLEPGQMLSCDPDGMRTKFYWKPNFEPQGKVDEENLKSELRASLRQAVARSRPDEKTACFLSGGLDSSTVAGLANAETSSPMRAYSIGFQQKGYDEMAYARLAASHFGLELREYYVSPDDIADAMPLIASAYDEPFGNSSAIPAYFCAKQAKNEGVNRLLAGDGGDEIFGGNERYAIQHIFARYALAPAWIRSYVIEPALFNFPTDWNVITRKARRYVEQARLSMPDRLQTYNYLYLNSPQDIFDADFLTDVDTHAPIDSMKSWYGRSGDTDLLNKMMYFDWKLTLADNDLRKVNRMCELVGMEVDYPFLDDQLIAMSTRIPSNLKMKNNKLRYFFKSALEQFLPRQILDKEKHGFGLPFGEWLKTSIRLQDAVLPQLELLKNRHIFKTRFIDKLLHQHNSEHAAYYGNIIWVLTMLEMWLQIHTIDSARR